MPTVRLAPVIAVVAAACVSPTTFGTAAIAGPDETTSATAEPLATLAAAAGFSLMTLPEATVLLDCMVTVPSTSPAPVIALVAAACVSPTTFGTLTCAALPDPLDPPPQATRASAKRGSTDPLIIRVMRPRVHVWPFVNSC